MSLEKQVEHLSTQKIYPVVNNDDLLEFRIPGNIKGHLDLGNVLLHFITSVPKHKTDATLVGQPENFYGPKQFSTVEVRINGEAITRRSCANEYFLSSYFQHLCNYAIDYQITALRPVGIFDYTQNITTEMASWNNERKAAFKASRSNIQANIQEYEILMAIDSTLFYTNDLLPSNTPIDLSFERLSSPSSTILLKSGTIPNGVNKLSDVYLIAPFKKDENLFHLERNAISRPIKIKYDDYVIKRFNVTSGSQTVMMSNLMTGQLPSKLFWALQSIDAYAGSNEESSTRFHRNGLVKANLYIDGKEADDFPVTMSTKHVAVPFVKFLENTNQQQNGIFAKSMSMLEFETSNFIMSKTLDPSTTGSISFEFEFESALSKGLILITCGVFEKTLKVDHNRNIQVV